MSTSWFSNITIRLKIFFLAGFGALAFLAFFLYADHISSRNAAQMEHVMTSDFPAMMLLHKTDIGFLSLRDGFTTAINNVDPDALHEAHARATSLRHDLVTLTAHEHDGDPAHKKAASDAALVKAFDQYVVTANRLADGVVNNKVPPDQLYQGISDVKSLEESYHDQFSRFQNHQSRGLQLWLLETNQSSQTMRRMGGLLGVLTLTLLGLLGWRIARSVTSDIDNAVTVAHTIAQGDWEAPINARGQDEIGRLLKAIHSMRETIKARIEADRRLEASRTRMALLNECMRGDLAPDEICGRVLNYLAEAIGAQIGAFYLYDAETARLTRKGGYALSQEAAGRAEFALGESLLGQAARLGKPLQVNDLPVGYFTIRCGSVEIAPRSLTLVPVLREQRLVGILELGSLQSASAEDLGFLEAAADSIGIYLSAAASKARLAQALQQSQTPSVPPSAA